ncbi:beta-glucosidase, partial [Colletotrichum salicis]
MRSMINLAIAASLAAGVVAQPHNHRHRHVKKDTALDQRDVVVVYESGPTVVAYELGGKPISEEEAKQGIADGLFVVVGETVPSSTPLPSASTSTAPTPSVSKDAQFFEAKVNKPSTSSTPTPTPTPT